MTIKKITDFNFPVGKTQLSQDAYYRALSAVDNGFYPFSENGLWHGGIHINGAVLKKINGDDKLRCMANGEVIAYRVNDVYPKIVYDDDIKPTILSDILQEVVYFSSGFTLVRHYLSMPEIEDSTEVPPSIMLYSLYMHQLDWYGYQQRKQNNNVNVEHPAYWQIDKGEVNTETSETIKGTAIRENGSNTTVIGLLLKGSKVRLGEQHKKMLGWYKIVSITEGTLVTLNEFKTQLGNITGYVWRGDIGNKPTGKNAEVDKDYEICKEDNEKIGEQEVEVKGIAVYSTASETTKLTYLPQSATFEFDEQENGYAKIRKISNCEVPATLVVKNGSDNAPHKGYIKLTALNLTEFKPEKLDKIVVLKKPVPINVGDFIGYIGHNVSQSKCVDDQKKFPLSNMKRKLDSQLPQLAHIELFTCDDLPVFINKTRALADKLPKTKKTILLVEKGARLIQSPKPTGFLPVRVGIKFISDKSHYYVKVKLEYTLLLLSSTSPSISFDTTKITINGINDNAQNKNDETSKHRLTFDDKNYLVNQYKKDFPELTITDMPDEVELLNNNNTLPSNTALTIRFVVENKHYWIASKDVLHLNEQDGLLTSQIQYWNKFPLALDNLPVATEYNIVDYPRTVLLNSESFTAVDDNVPDSIWHYVETVNKKNQPIQGWVNTKTDAQEHIKLVTPWHWPIFKTVEETATLSELSNKIDENKIGQLALAGYTPVMKELHDIIKNSFLYLGNSNKSPLPPFTNAYLKSVLNTSWTAEQLGHLLIKYESEWYADESLSKWDEMNGRFDDEKQQKKDKIEKELIKKNLTQPYQRDFAMQKVDEAHEYIKTNCQLEKEQRIKSSLWWKKVAEAQSANTNQTDANTNTPKRSNLSTNGKAWFIHPVAMVDYFPKNRILFKKNDKHEIIREINIRLAGFGGNVPTDEFTERTEKMIKQFQRDYMKVEETGFVDMQVIQAIDKFRNDHPIERFFEQAKCDCSELLNLTDEPCDGFGFGKYATHKENENILERQRKYEYPGIHRTVFWVLRSIMFYIKNDNQYQHLTISYVSSGYRCWVNNNHQNPKRNSTNHMGKAIDIVILNKGKTKSQHTDQERINCCDLVRDILTDKAGAQYRWTKINKIALENSRTRYDKTIGLGTQIADIWVHYDVRTFELPYLKDNYFVKTVQEVNGKYMLELL